MSILKRTLAPLLALALLLSLFACSRAAVLKPNPPLVLGDKYLNELDYEQALLQFDEAIQIDPKNPRGYLGKADALLHLDRQDEAAAALGAGAKATRAETREALSAARAAAETSPVDGYVGLAEAYEKLSLRNIALALLRRVCEELPEESRLKAALERLLTAPEPTGAPAKTKAGKGTTEAPKKKWLLEREDSYNADGSLISYYTFQYDENGNRTRYECYYSSGLSFYETIQYDANGKQARYDQYFSDGSHSYGTYQYDANGNQARSDFYSSDGSHTYRTYQYDANGNQTRSDFYSSDGSLDFYYTYQYDADGKQTGSDTYYSDGRHSYTTYQYDANGNCIRRDRYDADGKLTGYFLCTYTES
ncbi:MAG: hypothetical protein LBJ11_04010 [Oscillospiraceae bacterium]|jgi:hypothetical protein|nr:hypothetical protein [Oscillospiraceae bacterium]